MLNYHYICLFLQTIYIYIAIFTTDTQSLQSLVNNIYTYSNNWGLKINVSKTNVCGGFLKKRRNRYNFEWFIHTDKIEEVVNCCYLRVLFSKTGNLKLAVKALTEQANRAMNNLLALFKCTHVDLCTKCSLFDSLVVPILLYASEVWGIYGYTDIYILHMKFCKLLLGVRKQTVNAAVL